MKRFTFSLALALLLSLTTESMAANSSGAPSGNLAERLAAAKKALEAVQGEAGIEALKKMAAGTETFTLAFYKSFLQNIKDIPIDQLTKAEEIWVKQAGDSKDVSLRKLTLGTIFAIGAGSLHSGYKGEAFLAKLQLSYADTFSEDDTIKALERASSAETFMEALGEIEDPGTSDSD